MIALKKADRVGMERIFDDPCRSELYTHLHQAIGPYPHQSIRRLLMYTMLNIRDSIEDTLFEELSP